MNNTTSRSWLTLRQLNFLRGDRSILRDISLELHSGELVLLTGQNGSGKTTLLRILAGLLKPQQARLVVEGKEQSWRRSRHLLRREVCYLHQQPYLFDCSVAENIAYGLRCQRLPRATIQQKVDQALQLISLEHLADRNSRELSGGEKQRVAIARAWALSPRLMLLDEPVASLDKRSRSRTYALMSQLQQQQISVIYTSHEPQLGNLVLDRHIHLYDGALSHKLLAEKTLSNGLPIAPQSASGTT